MSKADMPPILRKVPADAILRMDEDGRIRHFMVVESTSDHHFDARVYEVCAWELGDSKIPFAPDEANGFEEVAVISLKWDGCGHVGFRSPQLDSNWVHVCGAHNMMDALEMLRWMWQQARLHILEYNPDEGGELE